jgi:hypothetical protein
MKVSQQIRANVELGWQLSILPDVRLNLSNPSQFDNDESRLAALQFQLSERLDRFLWKWSGAIRSLRLGRPGPC